HVVLAVTKMDLVGWSEGVFKSIVADYAEFAKKIGLEDVTAIPISGLKGDNIASRSSAAPWYDGPSLIEHLQGVVLVVDRIRGRPLRMLVRWDTRPDLDFRGFAGLIVSGSVKPGDKVRVLPSGRTSTVGRIVTFDGDLAEAGAGRSVTLTLADEI